MWRFRNFSLQVQKEGPKEEVRTRMSSRKQLLHDGNRNW